MDLHLSDGLPVTTCLDPRFTSLGSLVGWFVGKFSLVGTHEDMVLLVAKILHQLVGSLSHYLQGFIHPRWCRISSINSMIGYIYLDIVWCHLLRCVFSKTPKI